MKKREPVRQKDNVFFFPGIEKRLAEKGLESLQMKRFSEAITLLEDARELDPGNEDVLVGLVLAYFEAAAFQKAKILAKEMLLKGIGDYLQMVDLYLTILIQLHEYSEIVSTIEILLDEKEIPAEKTDHFLTILQFSKRMAENNSTQDEDPQNEEIPLKKLNLLALKDPKEQMLLVSSLSDKNIRPYINEIKEYLKEEGGHPFLKTLLLNLLKEQEYDKEIEVEKFNLQKMIIPSELPDIRSEIKMVEIEGEIKDRLENSDPILYENCKSLLERHFFICFPFDFEPTDIRAWAAAFHYIVLEYFGSEPNLLDFSNTYDADEEQINQVLSIIRKIEEISYPII